MAHIDPEFKTTMHTMDIQLQGDTSTIFYNDSDVLVIDNVLSEDDCQKLCNFINVTPIPSEQKVWGERKLRKKLCYRLQGLSELVMKYCPGYYYDPQGVADTHSSSKYYWTQGYINPSWRFVHCQPNSELSDHFDGVLVKSVDHRSVYTIMLYLQDSDGSLKFKESGLTVEPKAGRLVVFNQQLMHCGLVNTVDKYFCRSEVMYHREQPIETVNDRLAMQLIEESRTTPHDSARLEEEAFKLSPLLEDILLGI